MDLYFNSAILKVYFGTAYSHCIIFKSQQDDIILDIIEVNSDKFGDSTHLRICECVSKCVDGGKLSLQLNLFTLLFLEVEVLPSGSWKD